MPVIAWILDQKRASTPGLLIPIEQSVDGPHPPGGSKNRVFAVVLGNHPKRLNRLEASDWLVCAPDAQGRWA